MITVASVLRSGGMYTAEWVRRLAAGVARHLRAPYRFVCLSDLELQIPGVTSIPLLRPWPGWWAKLNLFEPDLFTGHVLYLDLDTVIVGSLEDVAGYDGNFCMLSDFYRPQRPASGMMAWQAGAGADVHAAFLRDPHRAMASFHGDQEYIAALLSGEDRFQALYLGQVVSYKVDCRHGVPAGARVVCFHGAPKPSDLPQSHPLVVEWRREREDRAAVPR